MGRSREQEQKHTQEKVISIRTKASNLKDFNQVIELPVYISHHCDGRLHMHDVALLHQELLGLGAYRLDDRFSKQVLLVQRFDALIKINRG